MDWQNSQHLNDASFFIEQRLLEQRRALDEAAIVSEADLKGNITDVNPKFIEISGYSRAELLGQNHRILNSGTHDKAFFKQMWQTILAGKTWQGDICNRKKNGELYWVSSTIIPILNPRTQKPVRFQSIRFDITPQKQLETSLHNQATIDPLTKVYNRFALKEYFECAKSLTDRQKTHLAVCIFDIDNFKNINHQFGHYTGDQVLIEVARRVKNTLRGHDLIARLGGNEFVLLLHNLTNKSDITGCLSRVSRAIEQPIKVNKQNITLGASFGVAFYPDHDKELDTLLRNADHSMFLAKQKGKNQYVIFDPAENRQQQDLNLLYKSVHDGLAKHQFSLYYQPKVNMRSGDIFGLEALLRWHHPVDGLRSPLSYLPKIEQDDIIIELGNWVLDQALQQITVWHQQGKNWVVSVNMASHHLQQNDFYSQLTEALARHPEAPAHLLELEILETVVLTDTNYVRELILKCQALGVQIALDDFGTGYSSLSYLKKLPTNTIKIDQSFMRDMHTDPGDLAIIQASISIGEAFNQKILAEGVETAEQGVVLMRLGCDLAQGYGIAKPMPAEHVIQWAQNYQPSVLWQQWNSATWPLEDLPLIMAQRDHLEWIEAIEKYIQIPHKEAVPKIEYHHQCAFGQWYYGDGKRYANQPAYHAIAEPHKKIHTLAKAIIRDIEQGHVERAEPKIQELHAAKQHILACLADLQALAFTTAQEPFCN